MPIGLWVHCYETLWDHWKTARLATTLGIDHEIAVVRLLRLWTWALKFAPTGDLSKHTPEEIAFAAKLKEPGITPKQFVDALHKAEWLDKGVLIHDWSEYGGKLAADRDRHAENSRNARARSTGTRPDAPAATTDGHTQPAASLTPDGRVRLDEEHDDEASQSRGGVDCCTHGFPRDWTWDPEGHETAPWPGWDMRRDSPVEGTPEWEAFPDSLKAVALHVRRQHVHGNHIGRGSP